MRVTNFLSWQNDSIFENVQAAKDFMMKMHAEMAKKKPSEISDDEKKKVLNNPGFVKIKDMLQRNPGWTLAFTRFHFIEGASMEDLKNLFDTLMSKRQSLGQLPMDVEAYSKISDEDKKEDKRPGWERLGDDLINLDRKAKLKIFYNELTSDQKKMFDKATPEQMDQMTEIANQFSSKDPEALRVFSKSIKRFKTVDDLIDAATSYVTQYGKGFDELFDKIQELGAQVGVMYNRDGYFIFSTRSPDSIKKLCGDASWCIVSTSSQFWNYSGGRIQLNAYNFNEPVTNRLSLIGMTVEPSGKIYAAYDRPNGSISNLGSTYQEILKNAGFPKEAIDSVQKKFDDEVNIKLVLEKFFKEAEGWNARKIINSLISISRSLAKGIISQEDWEQISGAVSEIIVSSEQINKSTILEAFKENGIYSESGWSVFDTLIGGDYTSADLNQIKETTKGGLEDLKELVYRYDKGQFKLKDTEVQDYRSALDRSDWILSQFSKREK